MTSFSDWDIPLGVEVFTADYKRLGVVMAVDAAGILVEDTYFARDLFRLEYADIERYEDRRLYLNMLTGEVTRLRQITSD